MRWLMLLAAALLFASASAHKFVHPLSFVGRRVVAAADDSVTMDVQPRVLQSGAGWVTVSWKGVSAPSKYDWFVGFFHVFVVECEV